MHSTPTTLRRRAGLVAGAVFATAGLAFGSPAIPTSAASSSIVADSSLAGTMDSTPVAAGEFDLDQALLAGLDYDQAKSLDMSVTLERQAGAEGVRLAVDLKRSEDGKIHYHLLTQKLDTGVTAGSTPAAPGGSVPSGTGSSPFDQLPIPAEAEVFYDAATQTAYRWVHQGEGAGSVPTKRFRTAQVSPEEVDRLVKLDKLFGPVARFSKMLKMPGVTPVVADETVDGVAVRTYTVTIDESMAAQIPEAQRDYEGSPMKSVAVKVAVTKESALRVIDVALATEAQQFRAVVDVRGVNTPVTIELPAPDQVEGGDAPTGTVQSTNA